MVQNNLGHSIQLRSVQFLSYVETKMVFYHLIFHISKREDLIGKGARIGDYFLLRESTFSNKQFVDYTCTISVNEGLSFDSYALNYRWSNFQFLIDMCFFFHPHESEIEFITLIFHFKETNTDSIFDVTVFDKIRDKNAFCDKFPEYNPTSHLVQINGEHVRISYSKNAS